MVGASVSLMLGLSEENSSSFQFSISVTVLSEISVNMF